MTPTPEQIEAEAALRRIWNEAIERCAQVAEEYMDGEGAAAAIRALKDA